MAVITPVGRSPTSPSLHCRSVRKRFAAAYDGEFAADMQRNWMSSGVTIRLAFFADDKRECEKHYHDCFVAPTVYKLHSVRNEKPQNQIQNI
jgi:hypothetical protein